MHRRSGARLTQDYFVSHRVRKLHLGAGPTVLPGWLNTDVYAWTTQTAYLDATKRFPFPEESFDYVFSEHMIEHVWWTDALFMLRECWRVLKPGGRIRIATPDLAVLTTTLERSSEPMSQKYIRWITDKWLPDIDLYHPCFVLNNAFKNWGHQLLYDESLLREALERTGFAEIRRCSANFSEDEHLCSVDSHGTSGDEEFTSFETMTFEARRPLSKS
jgi:predicted SAM-dependent methyltransferase